jgi:diguanylate cyclase (GGDEF)-like protein
MMDLDDFKHINDTFGHQEGDHVLITVSKLIREAVEELGLDASGGRWGGEEFMILLPGVELEEAAALAEKLRAGIEELRFPNCSGETASFGVAQARPNETADPLVFRADAALYEAKRSGKNRVCASESEEDAAK